MIGAGILGLSVATSGAMFYLNLKLSLAMSSKKKPYNEVWFHIICIFTIFRSNEYYVKIRFLFNCTFNIYLTTSELIQF